MNAELTAKIVPGSVVVIDQPGRKGLSQIFVRSIAFTLESGNLMLEGAKITRDGFTDGRSRGKTMHYVFAEDIINVYRPEQVRIAYPYCQQKI